MRHRRRGRKLGRKDSHYSLTRRNLVSSLFKHERIITTEPKAKEFRSFAEKLITLAKENTLHHYRLALAHLCDKTVTGKLFKEIAPRFKDRPGGYTRIIHLGGSRLIKSSKHSSKFIATRLGDGGKRVILELVVRPQPETEKKPKKAKAAKVKQTAEAAKK